MITFASGKESVTQMVVKDPDDLPDAVDDLLEQVGTRGVIAFYGEMGAGKTTVIREICRRLEVADPVNSPTFAIVNEYRGADGERICHFDFYRVESIAEALDFGCEEYFASGDLCLVEWPERVEALLPEDTRRVRISVKPGTETRTIEIF